MPDAREPVVTFIALVFVAVGVSTMLFVVASGIWLLTTEADFAGRGWLTVAVVAAAVVSLNLLRVGRRLWSGLAATWGIVVGAVWSLILIVWMALAVMTLGMLEAAGEAAVLVPAAVGGGFWSLVIAGVAAYLRRHPVGRFADDGVGD